MVPDLDDWWLRLQAELTEHSELQAQRNVKQPCCVRAMCFGAQQIEAGGYITEHGTKQRFPDALHVPRRRDDIDVREIKTPACAKDIVHRLARILQRVLDAVEALFFQNYIWLAVRQQCETGIVGGINEPENIHVKSVLRHMTTE